MGRPHSYISCTERIHIHTYERRRIHTGSRAKDFIRWYPRKLGHAIGALLLPRMTACGWLVGRMLA